jgi:transcriptional regulator with XRE-family HTH domain
MKIDGKIVGSELRSLRMKKRLSAEDVCDNVGIHVNSLYKYEKDASLLKFETLEKMLDYYGTDVFIFFKMINEYNHD